MPENITATYFQYMKEVLGVREVFLRPEPQEAPGIIEENLPHLQVLFLDRKPWSKPALDLFQKMREAMKLAAEQIAVVSLEQEGASGIQIKALQAQEIVSFDQEIFDSLKGQFSANLTLTVGPEILLKDAALKKITWADLQQVMKKLKT